MLPRTIRIALTLSFLALWAAPMLAAPVSFIDGELHVLPGDPAFADGDWIVLNGGSQLVVNAPAHVARKSTSSNDVAFGGDALVSAAGTDVRLGGGEIVGGTRSACSTRGLLRSASWHSPATQSISGAHSE